MVCVLLSIKVPLAAALAVRLLDRRQIAVAALGAVLVPSQRCERWLCSCAGPRITTIKAMSFGAGASRSLLPIYDRS